VWVGHAFQVEGRVGHAFQVEGWVGHAFQAEGWVGHAFQAEGRVGRYRCRRLSIVADGHTRHWVGEGRMMVEQHMRVLHLKRSLPKVKNSMKLFRGLPFIL
jgi:hypothetical protein